MLVILVCSIQSCNAAQFNASLSSGYEKITSPLVRIDLDSPLILVEGRTKLAGNYYLLNLSGVKDWELPYDMTIDISANAYVKQAPKAEDLNFSTTSLDATWRKKQGSFSVGVGPSVQRIWVANKEFRDAVSLQTDLTYFIPNGNFTNLYFAHGKSIYVDEFSFLDSKTVTISLTQHIKDIGFGFSALDLQFNASREKNAQSFDDLSNHAYYARVSIDREMIGLTWSVGASVTQSYFDEPFFDGFDKRRDRYVSYEFGLERKISDKVHASLDFNKGTNSSNLALFESDYDAVNLSLSYTY